MSIHFRSRIQSPINYNQQLFPGVNGCCCTGSWDDHNATQFQSTFGECNALGGWFSLSNDPNDLCYNTCFTSGRTGCCCACSYSGMTEGVEKLTCEDIGGNWSEGPCPADSASICISGFIDYTSQKKCCGYTFVDGQTQSWCFDVCTEEECSKLTVGNLVPMYYPTTTCEIDSSCQGPQGAQTPPNNAVLTGDPAKDLYGNCCVQGSPCRCHEGISLYDCQKINGSFYVLGEVDYYCSECIRNCTVGEA